MSAALRSCTRFAVAWPAGTPSSGSPRSSRMRARVSGAREIGAGLGASVRADGECARVCRCGWFRNAEHPQTSGLRVFWQIVFGGVLLSHTLSSAVPSALEGLASGFGMGPGVSPPLWPP
jgi:hypothetical protein